MRKIILSLVTLIMFSGSLFSQELVLKQDDLNAEKRPKGDFTSYESKDGSVYKIGDKITIGVPSSNKTFAFITEGDGVLLPITQLLASASGQQVEIKRIDVGGTKRTGFYASLRCKGLTGLSNYSVQLENAISVGEVKSFGMTSDEALAELKKAKDKLDLEIITQEEYDKIKADLMKYIK
jgi:beta-lactam-binding protein with PASTA domain